MVPKVKSIISSYVEASYDHPDESALSSDQSANGFNYLSMIFFCKFSRIFLSKTRLEVIPYIFD